MHSPSFDASMTFQPCSTINSDFVMGNLASSAKTVLADSAPVLSLRVHYAIKLSNEYLSGAVRKI